MSICIAVGGAVGYFNCLATQLQQFMCSRGYSDEFSGQHKFYFFYNVCLIVQYENICKKRENLHSTVKLGDKERFDKEQNGVKEPFPMTNCQFTS